jgi:hypothetical protein
VQPIRDGSGRGNGPVLFHVILVVLTIRICLLLPYAVGAVIFASRF